jgi:hypothetical protein
VPPVTAPLVVTPLVVAALVAGVLCTSCAARQGGAFPALRPPGGAAGVPLVVSPGTGWSARGLEGPVPAPGSCRSRLAADGAARPDAACTPGAVDGTVTQSDLGRTVCRPGGDTAAVRPPEPVTEPFKLSDLRAYDRGGPTGAYELDHLVPLELGGSSDTRNLWPEPDDRPAPGVANSKDLMESALHALVCAVGPCHPSVPLALAQRLIAADWTTALARARAAAYRRPTLSPTGCAEMRRSPPGRGRPPRA